MDEKVGHMLAPIKLEPVKNNDGKEDEDEIKTCSQSSIKA